MTEAYVVDKNLGQPLVVEEGDLPRYDADGEPVIRADGRGVRLALDPDDPPIPEPLGGVAQICSTLEQFPRIFFEIAPSRSNCMLFCQPA